MPRIRRQRLDRFRQIVSELRPRFVGDTLVPAELAMLVREAPPLGYVESREMLHEVALKLFADNPTATYVVFTLDVLAGVHDLEVHHTGPAHTLEQMAARHIEELREQRLPSCVVYAERSASPRHIGPARWELLQRLHEVPIMVSDVMIVSPEYRVVWSAAEHYGPDPFAAGLEGDRRLEVQAATVRDRLGLPAQRKAGDACDALS